MVSISKPLLKQISDEIVDLISSRIYFKLLHLRYIPEITAIKEGKAKGFSFEEIKKLIEDRLSS